MLRSFSVLADQLSLACKHSGAKWAVYVYQSMVSWRLLVEHGISKGRRKALLQLLESEQFGQWLESTLLGGKVAVKAVETKKTTWRCQQLFALPARNVPGILLVGADELESEGLAYFSLLAHDLPHIEPLLMFDAAADIPLFDNAVATGTSEFMRITLENLVQVISADQALLVLHKGAGYRISAVQGLPAEMIGMVLSQADPIIQELEETAGILERPESLVDTVEANQMANWAYLPLVYERQVIGLAAFGRQQCLTVEEMVGGSKAARLLSPAIMREFDLNQQNQFVLRLSLIDTLASLATPEISLGDFGAAAAKLLSRAFNAEYVSLWMMDEDDLYYDLAVDESQKARTDLHGTLEGTVLKVQQPIRIDNIANYSAYSSVHPDTQSKMVTPLRAQHQVLGAVSLESQQLKGFSSYDELLLGLLADQLAAQLASYQRNERLYQELEQRIKEQEMVEERLIRSAKLAAVGEMAAGVAHELNNPLTTVTGFAELILETMPKDSPEYEDMSLVLQEAHRARGVVRRLLDFSRQNEVLWMEVDINELLSAVLALVHHLALTSGVDVRVELWDELPLIRADRNQIQQVFLNLIHNAIQAMPNGGQLVLRTQVEKKDGERWISIEVQDNGEGIREEDLEMIFEPFFTTKPSGVGTGLGLSVSYGIVSDHGGYIDVSSKVDEGATFTVWLPVEMPVKESAEPDNA